jgi:hypothetical protein
MRRLFYISLGVTIGVMAARKATRLVESLSPESLGASASRAVVDFVADVREGMAVREAQLRAALEYDAAEANRRADARGAAGHDAAASGTL